MSKEQLSTSGKEIPKHKNALEEKYQSKESHVKRLDQDNIQSMVDQLPEPSGWRMLVLPFTPKEKTKGGIIFSQESLDKARIATNCGYVIKMAHWLMETKKSFQQVLGAKKEIGLSLPDMLVQDYQ